MANSDSEEDKPLSSHFKGERLKGDNYAPWHRSLWTAIIAIDAVPALKEPYVQGKATTPSPEATKGETKALTKQYTRRRKAYAILDQSLHSSIALSVPEEHQPYQNAEDPDPYSFYNWLVQRYSAADTARQAMLFQTVTGTRADPSPNVSPLPVIEKMNSAFNELKAVTAKLSGPQVIESIKAYALLGALNEDWGTWVSTIYGNPGLTGEDVIRKIRLEVERRDKSRENVIAGQALLAFREKEGEANLASAAGKPVPKRFGKPLDQSKYCDNHRVAGHTTQECYYTDSSLTQRKDGKPVVRRGNQQAGNKTGEGATAQIATGQPSYVFLAEADSYAFYTTANSLMTEYVADSGCTHTMVNSLDLLSGPVRLENPLNVKVGNNHMISGTHRGKLIIGQVEISEAYYVPAITRNLISIRKLLKARAGASWRFSPEAGTLHVEEKSSPILSFPLDPSTGLYIHTASPSVVPHAYPAVSSSADQLLYHHRRLSHISAATVNRMAKEGLIEGYDGSGRPEDLYCMSCIMGKGTRLAAPATSERSPTPGGVVHIDLWGKSSIPSLSGCNYFMSVYDDHTRKLHTYFLRKKDTETVLNAFKEYVRLVENHVGYSIKTLRSDNGSEFINHMFQDYLKSKGIEHTTIPPDAHAQMGRGERQHLVLLNLARTILADSGLPKNFWAMAVDYASYTLNRVPRGPKHQVPDTLWYPGRRIRNDHMRAFGSKLMFRIHTTLSKLDPRWKPGVLIGYERGTSYYKVWDEEKRCITLSRDVKFNPEETSGAILRANEADEGTRVNVPDTVDGAKETYSYPLSDRQPDDDDAQPAPVVEQPYAELEGARQATPDIPEEQEPEQQPVRRNPTRERNNPDYRALHRGSLSQPYAPRQSAPDPDDDPNDDPLALLVLCYHAAFAANIPQTYREAINTGEKEQWLLAISDELAKMAKYDVWVALERPKGCRTLPGKWVFTRKVNGETGLPSSYKARWVVKGFAQREGIDYGELFASVAHKDSIRVFLSIVNYHDLECDQVDIIAAFLNGELDEVIYVDSPEGTNTPSTHVLQLKKSLYGLKQAPRCFNLRLDSWLRLQGFVPSTADPCIYSKRENDVFTMISLHVDDQLIACNNRPALDEFKSALNKEFECKDSGPAGYFLGFNIHRDRPNRRLQISQEHYVRSCLERYGWEKMNSVKTPLPSGFRPTVATDEEFEKARTLDYPQIVGSILYAATITRPDLSYAAGVLARFLSKWNTDHYKAAKHVLRYMKGTIKQALTFDANGGKRVLLGYADADWGGCVESRKSTTGYVFESFGGPVAWKSRRQPTVALSTTEAEYMASCDAGKEGVWLRQLLMDLGFWTKGSSIPILNDNLGAIALSRNPVNHAANKHIEMRHFWLRDHVNNGTLALTHVPSNDNHADLLTKSLVEAKFTHLRDSIGIIGEEETSTQEGVSEVT